MRLLLIPLIVWGACNLCDELYIFDVLKQRLPKYRWLRTVHVVLAVLLLAILVTAVALPMRSGSDATLLAVNWLLFIYLSCYLPKYIFVVFDLLARVPVLFKRKRLKWLSRTGVALSVLLFAAMWWGCLSNRYRIDVKRVDIEIAGLPPTFNDFTIAQISDLHVGTYGSDTTFVHRVVEKINSLNPDVIVFTGDIVNRHTPELEPFAGTLSRLHSPNGVLAILGNHDYGDYLTWPSDELKRQNMEQLRRLYRSMGWTLLNNSTEWIKRGNDSIAFVGVENIGDPPFHVYGSLPRAYPALGDANTKILLSHNPSHWLDSISDNPGVNVALTLSGHTHAMQMSAGRLSPAAFRYPTWGGLYADTSGTHQLYVNIGLGTVGLPMRLGATPEITLLTLKAKE